MTSNQARKALLAAACLSGSIVLGGEGPRDPKKGISSVTFPMKTGREILKTPASHGHLPEHLALQIHLLGEDGSSNRANTMAQALITKILNNQHFLGKSLSELIPPILLGEVQDFCPDDTPLTRVQKLEALALHMKSRFPYQKAIFALHQEAFRISRPFLDSPEIRSKPEFCDLLLSTAQLGLYSGIALAKHLSMQLEVDRLNLVDWDFLDGAAHTLLETERLASRMPEALEMLPVESEELKHYESFFPTTPPEDLRGAVQTSYSAKAREILERLQMLKLALGANGLLKAFVDEQGFRTP